MPRKSAKSDTSLFDPLGVTGLKRYGPSGEVYEEFLTELRGAAGRKVYREMRDNDPIVGAVIYIIEMLVRNVTWRVEGKNTETVEFVDSCREDMLHSWTDFIAEVMSMLVYGFSWHEVVYKRRRGRSGNDPLHSSKYDDGRIGWAAMDIRSQDTLNEWVFDDYGYTTGFVQQAPPFYGVVTIPRQRSLLFRTTRHLDNPEGRSILRSAYRSWFIKRRIENIEAIGVERDLAGLPTIKRTADVAVKYDEELKKILRNVRRDEQEGLLLPLVRDESGNEELTFELMSSGGTRQFNTTQVIERYKRDIATTALADFILIGHQAVGSFALASSKTHTFAVALGAYLTSIAEILNKEAIPRLLAVNGLTSEEPPELKYGDIETVDLAEVASYVSALAGSGMTLFPNPDLEKFLLELGHLPAKVAAAITEGSQAVSKTWPRGYQNLRRKIKVRHGKPNSQ